PLRFSLGPEREPAANPHPGQGCSANHRLIPVCRRVRSNRNPEIDSLRLRCRIEFPDGWSRAQPPALDRGSVVRPELKTRDRLPKQFHAGEEEFRKNHEWLKLGLRPSSRSPPSISPACWLMRCGFDPASPLPPAR